VRKCHHAAVCGPLEVDRNMREFPKKVWRNFQPQAACI